LDNRFTSSSEVTITVKPKTGETISNGKFLAGMVTISLILLYPEPFSKCSILFEVKEGENFNHRNTGSISRIEI